MALRNFWIEASIDGRRTDLEGGPRAKDGGMGVTIYQRDNGSKVTSATVSCYETGGELVTAVCIGGEFVGEFRTKR